MGVQKSPNWSSPFSASVRPPLAVRCMGTTTSAGPRWAGFVKRGGSALSRGLEAPASGLELPHGNGPSLPRNEGRVLGELRVAGFPLFTVITVPERFRGRAVTIEEWGERRALLSELACLSWNFSFEHFVPFFRDEGASSFRLCASLFLFMFQ